MVINFYVIRAFDKTSFADEIFGFGFKVIFLGIENFFLKNVLL